MFTVLVAFVIGVFVGAFSHKWLAAEAAKAGINVQADVAAVKQAAAPAAKAAESATKKV
jgi:hypothetical protein